MAEVQKKAICLQIEIAKMGPYLVHYSPYFCICLKISKIQSQETMQNIRKIKIHDNYNTKGEGGWVSLKRAMHWDFGKAVERMVHVKLVNHGR